MRQTANAITEEERAIASILEQPPAKLHWELALYGQLGVEHALDELAKAEKSGAVASGNADRIRSRLNAAHAIDQKVKKAMQASPNADPATRQTYVNELRNGLSLKRGALEIIEHVGQKVADGETEPTPLRRPAARRGRRLRRHRLLGRERAADDEERALRRNRGRPPH